MESEIGRAVRDLDSSESVAEQLVGKLRYGVHRLFAIEELAFVSAGERQCAGREQAPQRLNLHAVATTQLYDARAAFPLFDSVDGAADELRSPRTFHELPSAK